MKEANAAETKKVLDAVFAGDPIPAGFAYDPHGRAAVLKLDGKEHETLQNGGVIPVGATEVTPAPAASPAEKS